MASCAVQLVSNSVQNVTKLSFNHIHTSVF
nr:Z4ELP [Danio rerio]AAD51081.1 Z4ELP [Danio rerio]